MSVSLLNTYSKSQIDLGFCPEHNRPYECYSLQANQAICASCLMFGSFKGNDVIGLDEANIKLRKDLDQSLRQGVLKVENIQNVLLDIRHTILSCEEQKQMVLTDCSKKFKDLIKSLKQRQCQVEKEIQIHFDKQLDQLKADEKLWEHKEEFSKDLINCAKSTDDLVILNNSKKIIETLQDLKQEKVFKKVFNLQPVETDFKAQNSKEAITMNHLELIHALENHIHIGDAVNLQYRS